MPQGEGEEGVVAPGLQGVLQVGDDLCGPLEEVAALSEDQPARHLARAVSRRQRGLDGFGQNLQRDLSLFQKRGGWGLAFLQVDQPLVVTHLSV